MKSASPSLMAHRLISQTAFSLGVSLIFFCTAVFTGETLCLHARTWLGLASPGIAFRVLLSLSLWIGGELVVTRRSIRDPRFWGILLATLSLVVAAMGINAFFLDFSYDGSNYHQTAVLDLARGWNPFAEGHATSWRIEHFPKFPWIFAQLFYSLTGSLDASKGLNSILLLAAFSSVASVLVRSGYLSHRMALLAALPLALSPIAMNQLFTYCVDGAVISLIVVAGAMAYESLRDDSGEAQSARMACGAALILLVNAKTTGLVHASVLYLLVMGVGIAGRKLAALRAWWAPVTTSLLVAFTLYGYSPYMRDFQLEGSAIVPLEAQWKPHDSFSMHRPRRLDRSGRFERLFWTVFAASNHEAQSRPELKIPFTLSLDEFRSSAEEFCRIGGFGPLFGGALLLGFLLLLAGRGDRAGWVACYLPIAFIFGSALLNPELWWVRFVPQLWLVPFFPLLLARRRGIPIVAWQSVRGILIGTLTINCLGVSWAVVSKNLADRDQLGSLLYSLRRAPAPRISIGPTAWNSIEHRLRNQGLSVTRLSSDWIPRDCDEVKSFLKPDFGKLCLNWGVE